MLLFVIVVFKAEKKLGLANAVDGFLRFLANSREGSEGVPKNRIFSYCIRVPEKAALAVPKKSRMNCAT